MTLSPVIITTTAKCSRNYYIRKALHTLTTWPWPFIISIGIAESFSTQIIVIAIKSCSPCRLSAIVFVQVLLFICKTKYINDRAIENFSNIHNQKTADYSYYVLILLKTNIKWKPKHIFNSCVFSTHNIHIRSSSLIWVYNSQSSVFSKSRNYP